MFAFTRKTDYALVALAGLAERAARGGGVSSARLIAADYGIPLPLLMNVLKDLVRGGVVESARGARGGYFLARDTDGITVRHVMEAIEGPVKVTLCCDDDEDPACPECHVQVRCPITDSVRLLNEQIHDYLSRITLTDIVEGRVESVSPPAPGRPSQSSPFRVLPSTRTARVRGKDSSGEK
ncbi:MAG: Rrf2 family transcriptional regulator [Gemmatimonadota bacterium]|nr:Rrf2 family transcriptional regulator [Gemmatimonadota bacterium]MDP6528254.1 Rrf2 family transcriptional regulator [Gemmatimonadota bacterium]MDP6802522.1 Rrf2 family transcriptional regulator [Gemmatimonadota bacterium]MDP7031785.1 Rrf2 family transcriptional regulator [Gemmatimonadota bacterium]